MKRVRGKTAKRVLLFQIILTILAGAGLAFAAYAILTPLAFDLPGDTLVRLEWERWPRPRRSRLALLRLSFRGGSRASPGSFHAVSLRPQDCWKVGGAQYDVDSIRYQAAFVGYATAAIGMRNPCLSRNDGENPKEYH